MILVFPLLSLSLIVLFFIALTLCKRGEFYRDSFAFTPFGIYVWGDALVLAPFWAVALIILGFFPPLYLLRFFLLFWTFRSAYEVVYWIGHQWAKSNYTPALLRNVKWLKPNDAAILYQVWSMCFTVTALFAFIMTFPH